MAKKAKAKGGGISQNTWIDKQPLQDQSFNINGVLPTDLQSDYEGPLVIVGGTPSGPFDSHRDENANAAGENKGWGDGPSGSSTNDMTHLDVE